MAQSDEKKIASIDLTQLAVIIVLLVAGVFMGFKFNRLNKSNEELSKRERQRIEENAVLKAAKDSLLSKTTFLSERLRVLEADVKNANKNTIASERDLRAYKERYAKLKDSTLAGTDNCPTLLLECEELNKRHEGYEFVLLANIRSYKVYVDTLGAKVKNLEDANVLLDRMNANKDEELTKARKVIRRRGIINWGFGGALVGAVIVLIAQ